MTKEEKEAVLHCLRAMIDEELCEECPLYGTTGTDHCEKDCVRLAIEELEQKPCENAISRREAISIAGIATLSVNQVVTALKKLPSVNPQKPICPSEGVDPAYEKTLNKWIGAEVLDRIRNEMHATAEKHEDGVYYLRDEWVDEIIDKYAEGSE